VVQGVNGVVIKGDTIAGKNFLGNLPPEQTLLVDLRLGEGTKRRMLSAWTFLRVNIFVKRMEGLENEWDVKNST